MLRREGELERRAEQDAGVQVIVFQLQNVNSDSPESYGAGVEQVREIMAVSEITRIPNMPPYVRGVMNLRGKIITVIDIKQKIGIPSEGKIDSRSRVIVTEAEDLLVGFLVDAVEQVMRIPGKDVDLTTDATEREQYVRGIAKVEGRIIVFLDMLKLISGDQSLRAIPGRVA
jgi:purine-binding chemotaxis protein CheW